MKSFVCIVTFALLSAWAPTQEMPRYPQGNQSAKMYNPHTYGAVGNGITDDTAAFTRILAAVGSAKASILMPVGRFVVGAMRIPANVTIDFSPGGSFLLLPNTTVPGGGAIDAAGSGGSGAACNKTSTSCSVTVTPSAASETYVLSCMYGYSSGAQPLSPTSTDSSDYYKFLTQSTVGQKSNTISWLFPNVATGTRTLSAHFTSNVQAVCFATAITGLGFSVGLDGPGSLKDGTGNPMTSGAATFQHGSFLLAFGGNDTNTENCTAGSGFTQLSGVAGQGNVTSPAANGCLEYQAATAAGPITATHGMNDISRTKAWIYQLIGLRPVQTALALEGGIVNPDNHQIFYNATDTNGYIDFTGNLVPFHVHPEWWGATSTAANATANTADLQAAIYGAFGQNRVNGKGLNIYNKQLDLTQIYPINGELKFYHIIGSAGSRNVVWCNSGGITQETSGDRILDGQSDAYLNFYHCYWGYGGETSSGAPLLDLDYSGEQGNDLRPQFIDFFSNFFSGNYLADTGVLGAKSGGKAQFSNVNFYDPEFMGFRGAGLQIGGNSTGRNTGRSYAENALAITVFNGDFQGNYMYGIADYGGGYIEAYGTSFEDGFGTNLQRVGGSDVYCEASQGPCVLDHVRSESRVLARGSELWIKNSSTQNQAQFPAPGSGFPVGSIITGSSVGGDGAYYAITADGGPAIGDGTPSSPSSATGGSTTTLVNTGASWTPMEFSGMLVSVLSGRDGGCYGVISSNTSTMITVASWSTRYSAMVCSAPDSTSRYVIEPNWNHRTVRDGGLTMVPPAEYGINGDNSGNAASGTLDGVSIPGEQIRLQVGNQDNGGRYGSFIHNVQVSRADWYASNIFPQTGQMDQEWQVVGRKFAAIGDVNNTQGTYRETLSVPSLGNSIIYKGPLPMRLGGHALVFSTGSVNLANSPNGTPGNRSGGDVWIGGRSDVYANATYSRNILETGGILGRPTPATRTNANGIDMDIQGGLSTGKGTPGKIGFWLSTAGSSGSGVNVGKRMWYFDPADDGFKNDSTNNPNGAVTGGEVKSTASSCTSGSPYMKYDGTCDAGVRGSFPAPVIVDVTSASIEIDLTGCVSSSYKDYDIRFRNMMLSTGSDVPWLIQFGTSGWAWDTTSGHYNFGRTSTQLLGGTMTATIAGQSSTGIPITLLVGAGFSAGASFNAHMLIYNARGAAAVQTGDYKVEYAPSPSVAYDIRSGFAYTGAAQINAIRVIADGTATMTGTIVCQPLP